MHKQLKWKSTQNLNLQVLKKNGTKSGLIKNCFSSKPNKEKPYTIVIPPPNVTGVLHMGHMLNNCIQDILIRRSRMLGYNALRFLN